MRSRLIALLPLSVALYGCSYHYDLRAVFQDGRVTVVPKNDKGTGCLWMFTVTSDQGRVVWDVDGGAYSPPPCDDKFPITYGQVPSGMKERVRAQPLQPGVTYRIEASDGDSYSGSFRLRRVLVIDEVSEQR
ncbi:hypothetical protein [Sphingomonas sp.]|uniref:hypothetical protein n=1 Tax=Sphingomonas sp. TaxID=28214 RepID=UPI0025E0A9BA|nr:hypothetical protein [Sphingomonas sp.]MBV9529138.1 hypothetical protein [Sphingomonas sp.]